MTITIENLKDEHIPVFKSLAKTLNAKCKINQLSNFEKELLKDEKKIMSEYKKGTLKVYSNMEEYDKSRKKNAKI